MQSTNVTTTTKSSQRPHSMKSTKQAMSANKKTKVQVIIPGLASPRVRPTPIESLVEHGVEGSKAEGLESLLKKMDSNTLGSIETELATLRAQKHGMENSNLDSRSARNSILVPQQIAAPPQPLFAPPQLDHAFRDAKLRSDSFPQSLTQGSGVSASPNPGSVHTSYVSNAFTPREQTTKPLSVPVSAVRSQETQKDQEPPRKKRKPDLTISLPPNPLLQSQHSTATPLVLPLVSVTPTPKVFTGSRRTEPAVQEDPPVAPLRPAWYEDYQLTGTEEDIPYLDSTWMKIDDADVLSFLRRFHRYVRGLGDSAIASPEPNDTEAALDGVMAILTKWQTIQQTRLGITIKDCQLNGVHVGERICNQAFKVGHHNILQSIANYFDIMVKSCEEEFRVMTLAEREDFQQYGEQSWLGCLRMDYSFFMAARDRIVEVCRAEIRRRNSEQQIYGVPPAGPQAYRNRMAGNSGPSTQSTSGGKAKKYPWNKGTPDAGEFLNIISSELRQIPPRKDSPSITMTPDGGATLNGSAMDVNVPISTAPNSQAPQIQLRFVQGQTQGMVANAGVPDLQTPPTQPPSVQPQGLPLYQTITNLQPQRIQPPIVPSQAMATSNTFGMLVPTPPASDASSSHQPTVDGDGSGVKTVAESYRTTKRDN